MGVSAAAGSAAYPLANSWTEAAGSSNYTIGLNAQHKWGPLTLSLDYSFTHGDTSVAYSYASPGAFFNLVTPAQAGTAFPDITFDAHALETNLRWQATPKSLSYRLYYRFAYENITDFHYTGLTAGALNNNSYLGVIPENFTAQTIGFFVQYSF